MSKYHYKIGTDTSATLSIN